MKKIAIFQGYFLPHTGGIERYTHNLAKELHKMGYGVIIVTSCHEKALKTEENIGYATIYRLPIYKIFSSRYPIIKKNKEYRRIIKKLEDSHIDSIILNTRFQLTTLVGAKFAKKNKIPMCVIEHGSSHFTVYNKILDFFGHIYEHLLTNKVKKYVTDFYGVSKACCEWLKHYKIQAKGVFYNSIDANEYDMYKIENNEKETNNKIVILFVGRLLVDKGIMLLKEAYKNIRKNYNNIELQIAGKGPLLKELQQQDGIKVLGKLEHKEIMELYQKADIIVNPSYTEGLPTVLLEAGLMKCAILATPVGGTTEIIKQGIDGVLCNTTIESIQEKLILLIQDKKLRQTLGKNIHNKIKKEFSWKKTASDIVNNIHYKERR